MTVPSILVIEDDPDIARVITTILRFEGYDFTHERDGQLGLDQARQGSWSAVILDLGLPTISGWEILDALRSEFDDTHPPVIIISATAEATLREDALSRGAAEYLVKPVTADVVARVVRQHVIPDREL